MITSSPADHLSAYAIAARPAPAPVVRAISSGLAPIKVANVWRKLAATEKKDRSSTMCGRIFAAMDRCTALSATRGIAAWAAKFRYVASSIGNHSFFQSIDCFRVISSHQPRITRLSIIECRTRDCTIRASVAWQLRKSRAQPARAGSLLLGLPPLRQIFLGQRRSGRLGLNHDARNSPAAGFFDRLNAVDAARDLLAVAVQRVAAPYVRDVAVALNVNFQLLFFQRDVATRFDAGDPLVQGLERVRWRSVRAE